MIVSLHVVAGNWAWPLKEQPALLTSEPPLQPYTVFLKAKLEGWICSRETDWVHNLKWFLGILLTWLQGLTSSVSEDKRDFQKKTYVLSSLHRLGYPGTGFWGGVMSMKGLYEREREIHQAVWRKSCARWVWWSSLGLGSKGRRIIIQRLQSKVLCYHLQH